MTVLLAPLSRLMQMIVMLGFLGHHSDEVRLICVGDQTSIKIIY